MGGAEASPGGGVPWVPRPALQAEQNKLLHPTSAVTTGPGHRDRGGRPMGVPWASAQSPDHPAEWRAPAKHPGVGPCLRLGASGCSGCPPVPCSAADTRPLLLKPRRPATLGGALPKVPMSGRGLGQLPGGRQPPSGAGGTVTVCSSPRLPEGGLRGRHCVQHGQQGTLALVSRETWRTDFKLRETAYRTKTFVQSHLGVSESCKPPVSH